jgi:hypothetical protein
MAHVGVKRGARGMSTGRAGGGGGGLRGVLFRCTHPHADKERGGSMRMSDLDYEHRPSSPGGTEAGGMPAGSEAGANMVPFEESPDEVWEGGRAGEIAHKAQMCAIASRYSCSRLCGVLQCPAVAALNS